MEGLLPARYETSGREAFDRAVNAHLGKAEAILDLGGGRNPTVHRPDLAAGVEYVGLDSSGSELRAAGPGSYSELVVADATTLVPELENRFDLVVSWQVMEHVSSFRAVADNVHRYLRPGGFFVARFSGSRAVFSLVNRALPNRFGSRLVDRLMRRTESNAPVFPATYDGCNPRSIEKNLEEWSAVSLEPIFTGATYFRFSIPLLRAYLIYEDLIARNAITGLATHYLLVARS